MLHVRSVRLLVPALALAAGMSAGVARAQAPTPPTTAR